MSAAPWSYADFLETICDPDHDDHTANLRWSGEYFDPEWFVTDLINKDLRNIFRTNMRKPLHQPKPRT